MFDVVKRFWL